MERFTTAVGAIAFLGATAVVGYVAITGEGDFRSLALGAIIGAVGQGASYFLRGRVQTSQGDQVTITADAPATASLRTTSDMPPRRETVPTP